jgi:hypothetical protein
LYGCYLQRKIPNSKSFSYGNWNETIGGIYEKIRLLDSLGYSLNNVFIYLDTDCTFEANGQTRYYDHYLLTKENKYKYLVRHYNDFASRLNLDCFKILIGKSIKPSSKFYASGISDPITNDFSHICSDSIINSYGNTNFTGDYIKRIDSLKKAGFFTSRSKNQRFLEQQISPAEAEILKKIMGILGKHHTSYYVVITPLYDQFKFNKADIEYLRKFFGNRLYDFSGINTFTQNEYNYPDKRHFLPYISKRIIDSIL